MMTASRLALVIGFACGSGAWAAEQDIVRTFPVAPGGSVAIDTYRGGIMVTESDDPGVRIAVHLAIGGDTDAEAERVARELQLDFVPGENSVKVVARHPQETRARFVWHDKDQIEPTFRVTVPRRCSLNLQTVNGSVIVGNISGRLTARAETGDVFLRHVGGTVDAETQNGDVVISQCDGTATARVLVGTIRLGVMNGPCVARDASGGIEVMVARAGVHAQAAAGTIVVGFPRDATGDSDLAASGGGVVARIDPAAKCSIDAATGWFSRVDWRLPVAAERRSSRRHVIGTLNGGGAELHLRASGGDVVLVPIDVPFD